MHYVLSEAEIDEVRASLRRNAQLFDRPHAYVAGVEDAMAALIATARDPEADVIAVPELHRAHRKRSRMI